MDTALMVPGFEGSIGPFPSEYADPHVYARSVNSGAGNCVCGAAPGDSIHTEIAPGVPVPPELAEMVGKSAEPQRFVLGIAYQAGPDPRIRRGVDGGRDYFTKAELEKACWSYMRSGSPQLNAFHVEGTEDCAEPVESFIWRWPDWDAGNGIVVKDGDWCLGAILSPSMWELHKAGKVNGLSPEGVARRLRVAKEEAVPVAKGTAVADGEDGEMTELVDARFTKVALVGAGANGIPQFLISKQDGAAGLLEPEFVRDLIAKAPQDTTEGPVTDTATRERVTTPNGIVLSGSPADLASFIHKAALAAREDAPATYFEQVVKAKYNADDLRRMAASGEAMSDESYPIGDEDDLDKAIHAVGRGGADHDAIRRHVIKRAKALGKSSMIPDNWNADGSMESGVSKEAPVASVAKDLMDSAGDAMPLDGGMDGMDPTVPLAMPEDPDVPGDPTDPGSPAWEAIDAASAQKWLSIGARFRNVLGMLAEREMLEAACADPDDVEHAWDLEDAQCAVDYALSLLAVYAAEECAEAELGAEMAAIGKALAVAEPALTVVEGLVPVAKAGRVLSTANEARLRDAAKAIGDVLASLPSAPTAETVAKEKGAVMPNTAQAPAAVAKAASPEEQARNAGPVQAGGTTGMGQPRATGPAAALPADGPQQARPGDLPDRAVIKGLRVAVYDQYRQLVGVTDPAGIRQPVAKADGDGEKKPMQAVFDQDGDLIGIVDPDAIMPVTGAGAKPADGAAAPAADDMTPQPAADAGMAADAVGKSASSPKEATMEDVLKGIADAQAAFAAQQAQYLEAVAKAVTAGSERQAEEMEVLKARLANVEQQPAAPRVFSNGQVPPDSDRPLPAAAQLRGQDRGVPQVDVAKAQARKRELYEAPDARRQDQVAKSMQADAIAALAAVHGAGPRRL